MATTRLFGTALAMWVAACGGASSGDVPPPAPAPTPDGIQDPRPPMPPQTSSDHPELFASIDAADTSQHACIADGHLALLAGLDFVDPPDHLELRRELVGPGFATAGGLTDTRAAGEPGPVTVIETRGAICNGDTSSACSSAFAEARIDVAPGDFDDSTCSPSGWCAQYFAFTRGTDVGTITTRSGLLSAIGGVDTAAKAFVVTWANDFGLLCDGPARAKARALEGGGFEVVAARSTLGGALTRFLLHVTPQGVVTILAQQPV